MTNTTLTASRAADQAFGMNAIAQTIATARRTAKEVFGTDEDAETITILARMVIQATSGTSAGFMRLPPIKPVDLDLTGENAL